MGQQLSYWPEIGNVTRQRAGDAPPVVFGLGDASIILYFASVGRVAMTNYNTNLSITFLSLLRDSSLSCLAIPYIPVSWTKSFPWVVKFF